MIVDEDRFTYILPLLTPQGALVLGGLLGAWIIFRESHTLDDPKLQCCEKTKNLFNALAAYEALVIQKEK